MELDLTLGGDSSRLQLGSRQTKPITQKTSGFDLCMDLSLHFNRHRKSIVLDDDNPTSEEDGDASMLQLGLLPRRSSPPSENGSSENGSSGNTPSAAAVAAEDTSSANRLGGGFAAVEGERGSDDDENGNTRKKLRLSKEQSAFLEESFKEHSTLNPKQKLALAKHLNLRPRQVEVWFQNRRARTKLRQTEVDCEYLKRCCDALTEENRRLQKEVQELRALKSATPFYMQVPATTLTMCPSCERVSASSTAGATAAEGDSRPRFFPVASTNQAAAI